MAVPFTLSICHLACFSCLISRLRFWYFDDFLVKRVNNVSKTVLVFYFTQLSQVASVVKRPTLCSTSLSRRVRVWSFAILNVIIMCIHSYRRFFSPLFILYCDAAVAVKGQTSLCDLYEWMCMVDFSDAHSYPDPWGWNWTRDLDCCHEDLWGCQSKLNNEWFLLFGKSCLGNQRSYMLVKEIIWIGELDHGMWCILVGLNTTHIFF